MNQRCACLVLVILAFSCSTRGGSDAQSIDEPVSGESVPVDPADQALCQSACDATASFNCADRANCLPGCLRTFAEGKCLPEERVLIACKIANGTAAFTCIDGGTVEKDGFCDSESGAFITCLLANPGG